MACRELQKQSGCTPYIPVQHRKKGILRTQSMRIICIPDHKAKADTVFGLLLYLHGEAENQVLEGWFHPIADLAASWLPC